MKSILLKVLLSNLLWPQLCFGQDSLWKNTEHWKLYNIHNKKAFNYNTDTLQNFKSIALNDSLMHQFLSQATVWPPKEYSLWMGLFVLSFETENKQLKKIVISTFGGFFYDPLRKRYFELPENERTDWYKYINENAEKLDSK